MTGSDSATRKMLDAANALIDALDGSQLAKLSAHFDDHALRSDWYYAPRKETGLLLADMDHKQQKLAYHLLAAGLSFQAFSRAALIVAVENPLHELEGGRAMFHRDPLLYAVSVYGTPTMTGRWGWRFQGHHVSVNYTIAAGEVVSATPLFLGANPARIQHDGFDVFRPLGDAEDRARELVASLTPGQSAKAIVNEKSPVDFVLGALQQPWLEADHSKGIPRLSFNGPDDAAKALMHSLRYEEARPLGIPSEELTPGQRDLLGCVLAVYADRFPEGVATEAIRRSEGVWFCWAGSVEPGRQHYYRLQGAALLVEYDNTQNRGNHVHTVCRHPRNDFGAEALALHYAWAHPQGS